MRGLVVALLLRPANCWRPEGLPVEGRHVGCAVVKCRSCIPASSKMLRLQRGARRVPPALLWGVPTQVQVLGHTHAR